MYGKKLEDDMIGGIEGAKEVGAKLFFVLSLVKAPGSATL